MAPTWRAHMPAQFTTFSQAMAPSGVSTRVIRPPACSKPTTLTPSITRAPAILAPRASDWVMSAGFAWPSVGRKDAPTRSPTAISGHSFLTSAGESRCISIPKLPAVVASRLNSVQRSALQARRRQPVIFQPVSSPVSLCRRL